MIRKRKYEESPKRKPIKMEEHKAFKVQEISLMIVDMTSENEEIKYTKKGNIYWKRETRSSKYRRMTHVSRFWDMLFTRDKIELEYEEKGRYMNFCQVCQKYEPTTQENTRIHQNYWKYKYNKKFDAITEQKNNTLGWECNVGC